MKKNRLGIIGAAMMAAATMATPASVAKANKTVTPTAVEQANSKATKPETKKRNRKTVHQAGGLSLVHEFTKQTNPPYQYAINNGAKKHGKKSNRLRYAHNAKVKRR